MIELSFDKALAGTSAPDFVESLLIGRFGVAGLAVGHDFSFGKGKGGSALIWLRRAQSMAFRSALFRRWNSTAKSSLPVRSAQHSPPAGRNRRRG